ncbi:MAG: VWA domain-containing protein [Planctomycetes bacterium]|nr:VWA domain-containing protein [Planctomycetota bacterium]
MSYGAQITRTNPACLLFLIDQSGSMSDPFVSGAGQTKAAVVADAVNRLIQNVVLRSAKADGVRDYFRIGVIGYGNGIKAGLGGTIPFEILVPISRVGNFPLRVETRSKLIPDGAGGVIEQPIKFPVWFDSEASGKTPMCEAFAAAGLAVQGFIQQFPDAYPPLVLNLTDGIPSDGNPQENARKIQKLATSDGNVLLFNLLISSKPVPAEYFPSTEDTLSNNFSKLLFRMSSELPPKLWDAAKAEGHALKPRARGVVLNADPTAIVRFLDIGTRITPQSGR